MAKVQFQVNGLDSNTPSIFNDDVTFDGNIDVNSLSIAGTDITQTIDDKADKTNPEFTTNITVPVLSITGYYAFQYAQLGIPTLQMMFFNVAIDTTITSDLIGTTVTIPEGYTHAGTYNVTDFITNNGFSGPNPVPIIVTDANVGNFDGNQGSTPLTFSSTSTKTISATEISYLDGISSPVQTQIGLKAPSASPTFTGTVVLPSTTSIGDVSSTEISYVNGVTSSIQTQLDLKALASGGTLVNPTITANLSQTLVTNTGFYGFCYPQLGVNTLELVFDISETDITSDLIGTSVVITNSSSGLNGTYLVTDFISRSGGFDNTDYRIIVTDAAIGTFDSNQSSAVATFISTTTKSISTAELSYLDTVSSNIQTQINSKASLASPTFTGTVTANALSVSGNADVNSLSIAGVDLFTAIPSGSDELLSIMGAY